MVSSACGWVMGVRVYVYCSCVVDYRNLYSENTLYNNNYMASLAVCVFCACGVRVSGSPIYNILYYLSVTYFIVTIIMWLWAMRRSNILLYRPEYELCFKSLWWYLRKKIIRLYDRKLTQPHYNISTRFGKSMSDQCSHRAYPFCLILAVYLTWRVNIVQ